MAITIDLPQEIETQLESSWRETLPRKILEAIAVEGYRQEVLSHRQVGELLDLDRRQTDAFLKEHGAYLHYGLEEYEADQAAFGSSRSS